MTREEAKEFIAQSVKSDVDMALVADAIKALEQEPRKDGVILTHEEYNELITNEYNAGYRKGYDNGYCKGYVVESEEQEPVLDKIRAEIKAMSGDIETIADVLTIIDKYKEDKEKK